MDENLYWLGFSVFSGIGPARFKKLLDYFGSAGSAWRAEIEELKKSGIGDITAGRLFDFRNSFDAIGYGQKLRKKGIKFLTWTDPGYPRLLASIKNPPIVLFVKGGFDFNSSEQQKFVGIVGTRKITSYGFAATRMVIGDLVTAGCVIVSGLAIGVDSCAHATTIENGGNTIAVLGSGVDLCTPAENISLYQKIIDSGGAIVSEYPLGQEPVRGSFPSRNRIIAGLCEAIVVTEGAEDSGALITAKDAFENNRKVFAIPGPITSSFSKGPNSLIVKGAIPVISGGDILKALEIKPGRAKGKIATENKEEEVIAGLLQKENMHIDDLVKKLNIPAGRIGTTLSMMEMRGLVRNCGSGIFGMNES